MVSIYIKYISLDQQLVWYNSDTGTNAYINYVGVLDGDNSNPYYIPYLNNSQAMSQSLYLQVYIAKLILQLTTLTYSINPPTICTSMCHPVLVLLCIWLEYRR